MQSAMGPLAKPLCTCVSKLEIAPRCVLFCIQVLACETKLTFMHRIAIATHIQACHIYIFKDIWQHLGWQFHWVPYRSDGCNHVYHGSYASRPLCSMVYHIGLHATADGCKAPLAPWLLAGCVHMSLLCACLACFCCAWSAFHVRTYDDGQDIHTQLYAID